MPQVDHPICEVVHKWRKDPKFALPPRQRAPGTCERRPAQRQRAIVALFPCQSPKNLCRDAGTPCN